MTRIQGIIDRLERGEDLSEQETQQILNLQALDVARRDELFAEECLERQEAADAEIGD